MTIKIYPQPKFSLAFDTETSGFCFPNYAEKHQVLSYGAAIVVNDTLEIVDTLYREIKFDKTKVWSKEAEAIHGLSIEYLDKNGVSMEEASVDLMNLIVQYFADSPVMLIGHNPKFDVAFMESMLVPLQIMPKIYHRLIDTSIAGFVNFNETNSETLFQKIGMPPRTLHNALEDVIYSVETLKTMREFFKGFKT